MTEADDDDAKHLFKQAMIGVQPLKNKQRYNHEPTHKKLSESTYLSRRAAAEKQPPGAGEDLSDTHIEPIGAEQTLSFSQSGIQHNRVKQLRSGLLPIQNLLDLHGYKIDEARESIMKFIDSCQYNKLNCVLIITGKSPSKQDRQNTLKSHVNHWLKQLPSVLAFCSSPPAKGGSGSMLVLLKKK
ncbi:MAG: Smr/MutS family protein [Candidatus Endonucleobacter bathymodioli]|uniref:Smr/MutS family protein n=1 Tax=Candidatus Endonucleibacter bathymodioli TaxID=539814 RepID=A0AA90SCB2_9GAMM|nr:Smr/MutS family protein [Candidatus Endonucleobacter bathymodioli]